MINIGPTGMQTGRILCGADLYGRPGQAMLALLQKGAGR